MVMMDQIDNVYRHSFSIFKYKISLYNALFMLIFYKKLFKKLF
ncbi:hypothetical protein wcw_1812 [Waddlia chondrophila WSU 86-1044]|uniref:Uncharacterized protein n=1 Tax=Waddlia chondrophila (strain ATCC VR-1470 / WSU 86-1044) TaxID=716544 RepID=D6YSV6_WADCW|nr:hypothetical protein wcw_1812 [Waddlia chondrophila WSU 86-1044]